MRARAVFVLLLSFASTALAQTDQPIAVFDHPSQLRFLVAGQMNFIYQHHGEFPAPYSGPQSFKAVEEGTVSRVLTLFTGAELPDGWDVVFDIESAGGRGLSDAFGLAGFTDLDVVRNPSLGTAPYLARLIVRKIIALSSDEVAVSPSPLALAAHL